MSWTIRNYNSFIREVRSKHGLTLTDARIVYRDMRETMDRPLKGVDARREPRLVKDTVQFISARREAERRPSIELEPDWIDTDYEAAEEAEY